MYTSRFGCFHFLFCGVSLFSLNPHTVLGHVLLHVLCVLRGAASRASGQPCSTAGSGCAGSFNKDVDFELLTISSLPSDVTVFSGALRRMWSVRDGDGALLVPLDTLESRASL